VAGILDYLAGNYPAPGAAVSPNDPTGAYLGGLMDPNTAAQFQAARAQAALNGLAAGFGANSGASRLPVTDLSVLGGAINGMNQMQNALPQQALQSAQTSEAVSDTQLKRAQVAQTLQKMQLLQEYLKDDTAPGAQPPSVTGGGPVSSPGAGLSGPAVSNMTQDSTLPPAARALLDTISGPESNGAYDVRYSPKGDAKFTDFSQHPQIYENGPQGKSSAAGRYQMVYSTWSPIQKQMGLPDFSPVSQDQAAWHLASTTYQQRTGRDLLTDLNNGNTQMVGPALSGQWATLNRAMPNFAANLQKYMPGGAGAAAGGAATPNNLPAVPNFSGQMSGQEGPAYAPGLMAAATGGGGAQPQPAVVPSAAPVAAPVGGAPAAYNAAPTGYGVPTPQAQAAAAHRNKLREALGLPANAADIALEGFPVNVATKNAESASKYGNQAAFAGQEAGNRAAAVAPFEMVQTTVTIGGKNYDVQVPKSVYLQGPAASAQWVVGGGSQQAAPASVPPPIPSPSQMPGGQPSPAAPTGLMPAVANGGVPPSAAPLATPAAATPTPMPWSNGSFRTGLGLPAQAAIPAPAGGAPLMPAASASPPASAAPAASMSPAASPATPIIGKPLLNPVEQADPNAVYPKSVGQGAGQTEDINVPADPSHMYSFTVPGYNKALPLPVNPDRLKVINDTNQKWIEKVGDQQPLLETGIQQSMIMRDVLSSIQSGAWTQQQAYWNAKLKAAGLPQIFDADPGLADIAAKENLNMTYSSLRAAGVQRITNMEVSQAQKANPSTAIQPEADAELLSNNLGVMFQQQALIRGSSLARAQGWVDLSDYQQKFYDQNPLTGRGGFVDRAQQVVGDLRGVGLNQGPQGKNPATQQFPSGTERMPAGMPDGTQKLPDGRYAVQRNGQWFEVRPNQ
jgi:muramidase (phage lysozyme)